MEKDSAKKIINLSKFTEFMSSSSYPENWVGLIFTALINVSDTHSVVKCHSAYTEKS